MGYALIGLFLFVTSANAALITPTPNASPAPQTLADKEADFAIRIKVTINQMYQLLGKVMLSNQAKFWSSADGLTPQQHFSAFGQDQCALRQTFLKSAAYLNGLAPGTIAGKEPAQVTMSGSGDACVVTVSPWPSPSPSPSP